MSRKSALSSAGASMLFSGGSNRVPSIRGMSRVNERAVEQAETREYAGYNRQRMGQSSLCFGFEGNDPYINHRRKAGDADAYRTSQSAPNSTQGRNLTYEDNRKKNMRGQMGGVIPGMLTERNHDYGSSASSSRRRTAQATLPSMPAMAEEEEEALVKQEIEQHKSSMRASRSRKQELEAKARALAMQMNRQTVVARQRVKSNQHASSFSVGVLAEQDYNSDKNLRMKSYDEVNEKDRAARNDVVRAQRRLHKENRSRNVRTQIHSIPQAHASHCLNLQREQVLKARYEDLPDMSIEQLKAVQSYLIRKGAGH